MRLLTCTAAALAVLSLNLAGCVPQDGLVGDEAGGNAVVVGRIVTDDATAKLLSAAERTCPEVRVSVNGSAVSIDFDNDCAFVIDEIQPARLVEIRVELVALGVAGSVEILSVTAGELIEIVVEPTSTSLSVAIERRATPDPFDDLPDVIDANNVSIRLPAGVYDQGLIVDGNNFTLLGAAGVNCAETQGWTVITGDVIVFGNNATFRNLQFAGSVTLRGNNTRFINCCFGGELIVFGNNTDIDDDDNDDDDDDDD